MTKMTKEEILAKIAACLEADFEIDASKITLESNLYTELDLDSIDAVDLIVKLQEITQLKITPANFKEVRTVGNVVDVVYEMLEQ
jgi:acyl carrier protein